MYRLLRFGVFELNLDLEEIRKNGTLLKLPPQPFELLAMLASRSGQLVTRDEIQQQLWGNDTFIDFEQGVNKCIKQIRAVLGDNAENPLYIETLPRHGYRFLAPVRTKMMPPPPPQVKEASSGLLGNVSGEVRARIEGGVSGVPGAPLASKPDKTITPQPDPLPKVSASRSLGITWILVAVILILLVLTYWMYSRGG